jgi:hypothetical protein
LCLQFDVVNCVDTLKYFFFLHVRPITYQKENKLNRPKDSSSKFFLLYFKPN